MRLRLAWGLGTLCALPAFGSAITYIDDFNDNSTNAAMWNVETSGLPSVVEQNGRLEFSMPAGSSGDHFYAQYTSTFNLVGDFDMQTTFDHLQWPADDGVRTGIAVRFGDAVYSVERTNISPGYGEWVVTDFNHSISQTPFSAITGALRLTRVGSTFSGFYWANDAWQLIGTGGGPTDDAQIVIAIWSHDVYFGHKDALGTFDDFSATDAAVPEPASLAVLGMGLAWLARRRRR